MTTTAPSQMQFIQLPVGKLGEVSQNPYPSPQTYMLMTQVCEALKKEVDKKNLKQ